MKVVAMDLAVADEAGGFESRQGAEHAALLGPRHPGLEADQVVLAAGEVFLAKLDHGVGARAVRRPEAYRLHRSEAHGVLATAGELLDRQAAFEEERPFELAQLDRLRLEQGAAKAPVLFLAEWAVQVVVASLAVARGPEQTVVVEAFSRNDGRDRVIEVEMVRTDQVLDFPGQGFRRQGAGGDDAVAARVRFGQGRQFLAPQFDQRVRFDRGRDVGGEARPVHGQRSAGGNGIPAGRGDDQGAEVFHLPLQQAGGMVRVVAAQRVRAHEFGEVGARMGRRRSPRPHLVQEHRPAPGGQLKRALATGESAANDCDGRGHWRIMARPCRLDKVRRSTMVPRV